MNKKTGLTIAIIIILIIIVTLYSQFVGFRRSPLAQNGSGTNPPAINGAQAEPFLISALHQFSNGKHIVAGEINLPTPCHSLDQDVMIAESFPEQVTINFTSQTQGEICAQVITPARFKTEFTATENASIRATWNGQPATLNLIPAAPGEDLENFEIFIKA